MPAVKVASVSDRPALMKLSPFPRSLALCVSLGQQSSQRGRMEVPGASRSLLSPPRTAEGLWWSLSLLPVNGPQPVWEQVAKRQCVNIVTDTSLSSPRSVSQSNGDEEDSECPSPVVPVDPGACVLPDATLCSFTVLDSVLITLAQGAAQWKVQLFACPYPGPGPRLPGQIGEVELSASIPPAWSLGEPQGPRLLPVLCCVSPPGCGAPHSLQRGPRGFTLEGALFGLLFGPDAALLESPVILCGLPDGQLCCVVLKTLVTSRLAPGDPKALVRILHHLEEPVIFIGALRTEPLPEDVEDACCDCLVALGHRGRTLAVKASWGEAGSLVPELREYCLPGPVLCAACGGGRVYHSTPSGLCLVDLARGGAPWLGEGVDVPPDGTGGLPSLLCPASLNICSVVTLSVSPRSPEGKSHCITPKTKDMGMSGTSLGSPLSLRVVLSLPHPWALETPPGSITLTWWCLVADGL